VIVDQAGRQIPARPGIFEIADQFAFFGIDANDGETAVLKSVTQIAEVEELIERATSVRRLLEACSACDCGSLDVCELFDDHQLRLTDHSAGAVASRLVALRDDARGDSPPTAYP